MDFAAFSLPKSSGLLPLGVEADSDAFDNEDVRGYFIDAHDDSDFSTAASLLHATPMPSASSSGVVSVRHDGLHPHPHLAAAAAHTTTMQKLMIGFAFLMLGLAPFTLINTLWSQTSIFRSCLPEGNGIGTLIGGAYNAASILPILYMFLVTRFRLSDRAVAVVCSLFGVAVAIVLAFFWKDTVPVGGTASSVVVITMAFAAGIVGALLGVVVFSYAADYPPLATTTLSLGMGINSVLITGLGFAQKAGGSKNGVPVFSPSVAFYIAAAQLGVAILSMAIIEGRLCLRLSSSRSVNAYQRLPKDVTDVDDDDAHAARAFRANVNTSDAENGGGDTHAAAAKAGTESRELIASAELPGSSPPPPPNIWNVMWAASYPCVTQFTKAVMVYFIAPGLLPFLTPHDTLVNALFFTAAASNLFGRLLTGFVHFRHLWLINVFCFICLAYELAVAMWPTLTGTDDDFPWPTWVLVPVTGVSALANGYVSTEVFLAGDRRVVEVLGDGSQIKRVRRWVSIANQAGSLVGTYLCVLVAHVHLLGPFRNDDADRLDIVQLCFS